MEIPQIINVTGIDGSGKTTVIEWLAGKLDDAGYQVDIHWLRFNHVFSKPLLVFCRLVGLTRYENIEGIRVGYHEFYRSRVVSWLFVYLQYLDALRVYYLYVRGGARHPDRVILLDRYVHDILIDLEIDTGINDLGNTRVGKAFIRLLPEGSMILPVLRKEEKVLAARPESRVDRNFKKRFELYEKLPARYHMKEIRNDGSLDDLLSAVAVRVGL